MARKRKKPDRVDHLIEALGFDRPHKPLRVCVHVRRLVCREQNLDTGAFNDRLEAPREGRVSINDQEAPPAQEALVTIRQIPGNLLHPRRSWVRRRACDVNAPRVDIDHERRVVADESVNVHTSAVKKSAAPMR